VEDNKRFILKQCSEHGEFKILQDPDAEFCEKLEQKTNKVYQKILMVETTDRCNLNCPHCYHVPKNDVDDLKLDKVYSDIKNSPKELENIILAGAEPTVRKEMFDIIDYIKKDNRKPSILTNGVRLNERKFVEALRFHKVETLLIGLNHWSYQGEKVHEKQLKGIENCIAEGIFVYYVGYTLENLEHMEEVLEEIQSLGNKAWQYRIRAGSDIGRSPDEPRFFLSDHVQLIKDICDRKGWTWEKEPADDNLYHYMVKINGITHRIIQWSDPKTIDMEQLQCGPWCDFVPGKPVTNFLHQIMLRDAVVNEGYNLHDTVPTRYLFQPEQVDYAVTEWTWKSWDDSKVKQKKSI